MIDGNRKIVDNFKINIDLVTIHRIDLVSSYGRHQSDWRITLIAYMYSCVYAEPNASQPFVREIYLDRQRKIHQQNHMFSCAPIRILFHESVLRVCSFVHENIQIFKMH